MLGGTTQLLMLALIGMLGIFVVQYVVVSMFAQRKGGFKLFRKEFLGLALYAFLWGVSVPLFQREEEGFLISWLVQLAVLVYVARGKGYSLGQSWRISGALFILNLVLVSHVLIQIIYSRY